MLSTAISNSIQQIIDADVPGDRLEYDPEPLANAYTLIAEHGAVLHAVPRQIAGGGEAP